VESVLSDDKGRALLKALEKIEKSKKQKPNIGLIDMPCILNTPLYDPLKQNIMVLQMDAHDRVFAYNTTSGCTPRLYRTFDAALRNFISDDDLTKSFQSIRIFTPDTNGYDFVYEQIIVLLSRVQPGILEC